MNFTNILIFVFSVAASIRLYWAMKIYKERPLVEQLFMDNHVLAIDLCDLPRQKKIDICSIILREITDIKVFNIYPYYFNKNAAVREHFECESHEVSLEYLEYRDQQRMFPCYARHNPIRTDPFMDDYYKYLFLSGGPYDHSLYLYTVEQKLVNKEYSVRRVIVNFDIAKLPYTDITSQDLAEEMQTLRELSFNGNRTEIETLYLRNKIMILQEVPMLDISYFSDTKKKSVCEIILSNKSYINHGNLYIGKTLSLPITKKLNRIKFWVMFERDLESFYETMYPCHTDSNSNSSSSSRSSESEADIKFWISGGFRQNSIIMYRKSATEDEYFLELFVENWNFNEIS